MMPARIVGLPIAQENPLWISWHDSNWIPILNPSNVMDYFAEKSNPFYDRTCNNEIIKMQRQSLEQLNNMVGVEYILLHVQDPILYVIRKQHRHNPTNAVPLADYYIIAGTVYQAPDLASVFNSRLLSSVYHLQSAFEEAISYSKYHPSKGYTFDFSSNKAVSEKVKAETKKEAPKKEEPSSMFQRQRVDMLLGELLRKFPPTSMPQQPQLQQPQQPQQQQQQQQSPQQTSQQTASGASGSVNIKTETPASVVDVKIEPSTNSQSETTSTLSPATQGDNLSNSAQEKADVKSEMKPPPEKKMKL